MSNQEFQFNFDLYSRLLKSVAALSKLYSDSKTPLLHPRFIEKLYVYTSNATDLSRRDMSFDALTADSAGVGIKTFIANSIDQLKNEKIAEFTTNARMGDFANLCQTRLAIKSAELRNSRVQSDAGEYNIDLNKSIYHCLVRLGGRAFVHEEPYSLIKLENIHPTDRFGNLIDKFPSANNGHSYFTDGESKYVFNISKNVLYKKFDLSAHKNSSLVNLEIIEDIFERISILIKVKDEIYLSNAKTELLPGVDFVVLPLYGTKNKISKTVYEKSGINQWNAGGRDRVFGEAYIPVPKEIHDLFPDFFPERDVKFKLKLPNGTIISAKICQSNKKALMSDPNTDLCNWIFKMIDLYAEVYQKRLQEKNPYSYADLKKIGKDSVKVTKVKNMPYEYEIESMNLDSYEEFINASEVME